MKIKKTPETKAERFKRLAESRVNRALKEIQLIGNLANKNNYEFTSEQASKIVAALSAEVRAVKQRFGDANSSSEGGFRL